VKKSLAGQIRRAGTSRPARRPVRFAVVGVIALGAGAVATAAPQAWASGMPAPASTRGIPKTALSVCSLSRFTAAVAAGGDVVFGTSCSLTLVKAVKIPASLDVSIDSGGFSVSLSGGNKVQLFVVNGGTLDMSGITLTNGVAQGKAGTNGANGVAGQNGTDAVCNVNGGVGGNGTPGTNGKPGTAGGMVNGGAIYISSGTVGLSSVTVDFSQADGGTGGSGGGGGTGGSGGGGGPAAAGAMGPRPPAVFFPATVALGATEHPGAKVARPAPEARVLVVPSTTPAPSQ
jgi:hypothetical protein